MILIHQCQKHKYQILKIATLFSNALKFVCQISHSCKNIICFKSIVKQTEFECGYVLCVYYILLQINCIITLIIHYVAHIICYVLLYIHIIILYYILKTHCQWITVEIHTVFNQSPKTLRWSVRQTQLLSKTVRILLVLFHPTQIQI